VSQDFLLQVFSWIIFPQASENPQICGLAKFVDLRADLPHVGQFGDCGPNIFAIWFADPNLLRTYNFRKS
jgi:hypothetical protein